MDSTSHTYTQNSQQGEITLPDGDGIFNTSSRGSFDKFYDDLPPLQDLPSWGQIADSSVAGLLDLGAATFSDQITWPESPRPREGPKESEQDKIFETLTVFQRP